MDLAPIQKSFTIEEINTESGTITVTYHAKADDVDLPSITLSMGLPVDERINDKDFVLDFVKLSYPEDHFQQQRLFKRYDLSDELKTKLEKVSVDFNEIPEIKKQGEEDGIMDGGKSVYGDEYRTIAIRHIIIETLEQLGLLK